MSFTGHVTHDFAWADMTTGMGPMVPIPFVFSIDPSSTSPVCLASRGE